ncbi:SPFH domain, Band 7 family protein [Brevinema andersonii]|uniref:Protein QmcA n=1 Tax=Brevinema andersonii TaxID=34097 RepID=A0A1I1D5Y6_BREAD|nr:SPFH domain-containing protein [Brevinema andersonii]SFB70197.1 SPFH domain, Band 7 family protein [Brevinema andersonii]
MNILSLIPLIITIAIIGVLLTMSIRIVQQGQTMLIERFGKFNKILPAGLNFIIPFLDAPRMIFWRIPMRRGDKYFYVEQNTPFVDLRETVYDFPAQSVITKDNVTIQINAVLYYQIMDATKAVYEIADLPQAIEKLTQTTLRNLIGELELDQTLSSRDIINNKLQTILDEATDKWGVKINRVELQDISPPADIQAAMEKQMRAEREKREMILRAEGEKQAAILSAEGEKQARIREAEGFKESEILRAEGFSEARERIAKAESESLKLISENIKNVNPANYLISLKYIETLKELGSSGNKTIMMPYEASAMIGSIGSIKEALIKG